MSEMGRARSWQWIVDAAIGVILGGIVGGIVAVNVVIYAGPDTGYESSISEVFRHNPLVGVVAMVSVLAGPIIGVVIARRLRHRRGAS